MPSTYSPDLRIELIANGEQSGYWGTTTNNNLGTLIEESIAKTVSVTLTSTKLWLTATNGASDEARCAAAVISVDGTITANFTAYIPPVPKLYVIKNSSAYTMTLRNANAVNSSTSAGGATVVITTGKTVVVRSDGTNCYSQFDYVPNDLQISGALTVDGATTLSGGVVIGNSRLSATYAQGSGSTTATFTVNNSYTGGVTQVYIGTTSGTFPSGLYTVATASSTNFTVTATAPSGAISGNAYVTDDVITVNGVISAGVVIEGSTTIPALRVTQTGTGAAILVEDSTDPDTSPFIVDASGNVGIGMTNPSVPFDTQAYATSFNMRSNRASGTAAAPTVVASGDTIQTITARGYDGAAYIDAAQISAAVDGAPGTNDMPGRLVLSTTPDGSATLIERVRVNNAGNVIIGSGEASATTTGNTLRAPDRTGTDAAGANLVIAAGNGTGTGGSGYLSLQTASPSTTGTTANTMVDRLKIQTNGLMLSKAYDMNYGVVPASQTFILQSNVTGTNATTAQNVLGVGVTLAANTIYEFEATYALFHNIGGAGHTVSLLFGGTATLNNIAYMVSIGVSGTSFTALPGQASSYIQVATAVAVTGGLSQSGLYAMITLKGTVSVNAAGTFIPQYKLSASPGTDGYVTQSGSYMNIYPVGAAGANINTGGWA